MDVLNKTLRIGFHSPAMDYLIAAVASSCRVMKHFIDILLTNQVDNKFQISMLHRTFLTM